MNGTNPRGGDSGPLLHRDPANAANEVFDLVVIGGGIQGACVALEASRRGYRTLLLERADFGGEASAMSLRILHGGLRYLQRADLPRFFESVGQRRWWLRTFPELVSAMTCVMPLDGHGPYRPLLLGAALLANDCLSLHRNIGVCPERHLPHGRLLSNRSARMRLGGVRPVGMVGAALWYDASMDSAQRLLMEVIRWAAACGASALNWTDVRAVRQAGNVYELDAIDRRTGKAFTLRTKRVVNAAGHGFDSVPLEPDAPSSRPVARALAFNLLLEHRLGTDTAVALRVPRPGGPVYFLRPCGEYTFVGTHHSPWNEPAGVPAYVPTAAREAFLADLQLALPESQIGESRVIREFPGILPAAIPGSGTVATRPLIQPHSASDGTITRVTVVPVKFTTAPAVARRVVDTMGMLSGQTRIPTCLRLRPACVRPLLSHAAFKRQASEQPDQLRAHLWAIITSESVYSWDDLLLRRLDWTLEVDNLDAARAAVAAILGTDTPWPSARAAAAPQFAADSA